MNGIEESSWLLGYYRNTSGKMAATLPDTTVTAHFKDGKLSGSAGCNRYFGSYTTGSGDQLSFTTHIGATAMACAPPVSEQERQYFKRLSEVVGFQLQDEALQLLDKNGQAVLDFTAVKPLL